MTIWKITFRIEDTNNEIKRDVEVFEESSKALTAISDAVKNFSLKSNEEIIKVVAENAK